MNGDAELIAALRERGDPIEAARPVLHWAYFSSLEGAELFRTCLADPRFAGVAIDEEPEPDDLEWRVYDSQGKTR